MMQEHMMQPQMMQSSEIPEANNNDDLYAFIPVSNNEPSQCRQPKNMPVDNVNPVGNTVVKTNAPIKMYNFNTSWCGWSKKFQPEWDAFMNSVKSDSSLNNIVDVQDVKCDNDANKQLCLENEIEGFPTVVVNIKGVNSKYEGDRSANSLISFLRQSLKNM